MSGLCTVSYCPKKKDPDWHRCFVCDAPNVEHHHVKSRGMGGSKKRRDDPLNVVALCRPHHEMVTLHECSDDILDFPGRGKVYVYFDLHGETLIERDIDDPALNDGAEARGSLKAKHRPGTPEIAGSIPAPDKTSALSSSAGVLSDGAARSAGNPDTRQSNTTSAPSPSTKEESDGRNSQVPVHSGDSDRVSVRGDRRIDDLGASDIPLTHEQRVAIAQAIKHTKQRHSFLAGDTANLWEEELNEDFWNIYANEFGYTYPSLRNVMRVCKRIPPDQRHVEMSFAHQELLQNTDRETREAWLERAFEEEWPVKRLREELVAEGLLTAKKKVKRWTVDELMKLTDAWIDQEEDEKLLKAAGVIGTFLGWLEGQA